MKKRISNKYKRILLMLLAFIQITMNTNVVFIEAQAVEGGSAWKYIKISAAALEWGKVVEPEIDLQIGQVVDVYNSYEELIGYSVSYNKDDEQYGYVVLDKDGEIIDSVIGNGKPDLYQEVLEENNLRTEEKGKKRLYYITPFDIYAQSGKENEQVYGLKGNKYNKKQFKNKCREMNSGGDENRTESKKYSGHGQLFQDTISKSTYTVTYTDKLPLIRLLSEQLIEEETGKYACAIIALTQIAYSNRILGSNAKSAFNSIWKKTETTVDYKAGGITYGSTLDSKLASGMKSYVKSKGKECKTTTQFNPAYSFFKNAVKADNSSTLSYRINIKGKSKPSGHTIFVVGCTEVTNKNTGKKYKFLQVGDGWNDRIRYINFSSADFVNSYGVIYDIY